MKGNLKEPFTKLPTDGPLSNLHQLEVFIFYK